MNWYEDNDSPEARNDIRNPRFEVVACCRDWAFDDFIQDTIHDYIEGGKSISVYCPHCQTWQFVDLFERAFEAQTVDEIIADERLSVDEIVDRMPPGWTLVSEPHFDRVVAEKNKNRDELVKMEKRHENWRLTLLSAAMKIGNAGGLTHREKDEELLKAIGMILRVARECDTERRDEIDEIPL